MRRIPPQSECARFPIHPEYSCSSTSALKTRSKIPRTMTATGALSMNLAHTSPSMSSILRPLYYWQARSSSSVTRIPGPHASNVAGRASRRGTSLPTAQIRKRPSGFRSRADAQSGGLRKARCEHRARGAAALPQHLRRPRKKRTLPAPMTRQFRLGSKSRAAC